MKNLIRRNKNFCLKLNENKSMASIILKYPVDSNTLINVIQTEYPKFQITLNDGWLSIDTGIQSTPIYSGIVNVGFTNPKKIRLGLEPKQPFATLIWIFPPLIAGILHVIDLNSRPIVLEIASMLNKKLNAGPILNAEVPFKSDDSIEIPDKCPNCKNPNTKKIRLCEWCGGQIC